MTAPAASLSPELLAQIKAIQIRTQHLVTDIMAGQYESAFRGRGMEFAEVREYRPGDDVRRIDWNVTARSGTGNAYIKEHQEERELTVMLLVDVSASGSFGTHVKMKREVAAEVAAVLAFCAMKSNDKVGLLCFSDQVEHYVPPKKGRAHLWRVIRDVLTYEPKGHGTSLTTALDFFNRVTRRRAVAFVISDFLDAGFENGLRLASRKHDLTAVVITDPRELSVPPLGLIELEDLETGKHLLLDTAHPKVAAALATLAAKERQELGELLQRAKVGAIHVDTSGSYVEPIVRFFRQRGG
jgi:uncharacterized protein (DUF58 family)